MAGRRRNKSGGFNRGRLSGGLHPGGPVRGFKRGAAALLAGVEAMGEKFQLGSESISPALWFTGVDANVTDW